MLTRFALTSFRCFGHVDVPLKPLTVLVGPNDSGKSQFFRAMQSFATHLNVEDQRAGAPRGLEIRGFDEQGRELRPGSPPPVRLSLHLLPSSGVTAIAQGVGDTRAAPALSPGGENIAAFLDHLLRRDRARFFQIVDALKSSIPGLKDLEIATPDSHLRRIDYVFEGGITLPGQQVSAGITLLTFFLCLAYHPDPPDLVLIEEPENSVHPKRLEQVAALLRSLTRGEHSGHKAQVIVSTHSPYLLDHIHIPEDEVLVFRRAEDGTRTVQPADAEGLKAFLGEFMMGEIWFNRGEDGLVAAAK